ncbi:MAG: Fic family protein [Legionellaceae bacterium]|nr:Fic family protein [Legionellaceae bacterium]
MKKSEKISLETVRKKFIYLFITDLARLPLESYQEYAAREPGFGESFLSAYIEAFNTEKDSQLSHELIKRINRISMSHMDNLSSGSYRTAPIQFQISSEWRTSPRNPGKKLNSLTYNVTKTGLEEFISKWFKSESKTIHQISISAKESGVGARNYMIGGFAENRPNSFVIISSDGTRLLAQDTYHHKNHFPIIKGLLENDDYQFQINLNSMCEYADIQEKIHQDMEDIILNYNKKITASNTSDQKIEVIVDCMQRIDQLHPFPDGNIRTCYILLNKLLSDNNLPMCILLNPNRLDCCDLKELMRSIKEGQDIYKQWLRNTNPERFVVLLDKKLAERPWLKCEPIDLNLETANSFLETILGRHQYPCSSVTSSQRFFISSQVFEFFLLDRAQPHLDAMIDQEKSTSIRDAINRRNYSLALRRASAFGELQIIKIILSYKTKLAIDVNEQSKNQCTALDWLNILPNSKHVDLCRELLLQAGAMGRDEIVSATLS